MRKAGRIVRARTAAAIRLTGSSFAGCDGPWSRAARSDIQPMIVSSQLTERWMRNERRSASRMMDERNLAQSLHSFIVLFQLLLRRLGKWHVQTIVAGTVSVGCSSFILLTRVKRTIVLLINTSPGRLTAPKNHPKKIRFILQSVSITRSGFVNHLDTRNMLNSFEYRPLLWNGNWKGQLSYSIKYQSAFGHLFPSTDFDSIFFLLWVDLVVMVIASTKNNKDDTETMKKLEVTFVSILRDYVYILLSSFLRGLHWLQSFDPRLTLSSVTKDNFTNSLLVSCLSLPCLRIAFPPLTTSPFRYWLASVRRLYGDIPESYKSP